MATRQEILRGRSRARLLASTDRRSARPPGVKIDGPRLLRAGESPTLRSNVRPSEEKQVGHSEGVVRILVLAWLQPASSPTCLIVP